MGRLEEISERCHTATQGPWFWTEVDGDDECPVAKSLNSGSVQSDDGLGVPVASAVLWVDDTSETAVIASNYGAHNPAPRGWRDFSFIAHARTDMPWLIEMLQRGLSFASHKESCDLIAKVPSQKCTCGLDEWLAELL